MMTAKIVAAAVLLLSLAAPASAGESSSGLCPDGFNEMFNAGEPGCTLCSAPTDCNMRCTDPGTCFCEEGGGSACCRDNPCCDNCPEPKPLRCTTKRCACSPESCCSIVCPATPAPASSSAGLIALAGTLLAFGIGAVRVASRRR